MKYTMKIRSQHIDNEEVRNDGLFNSSYHNSSVESDFSVKSEESFKKKSLHNRGIFRLQLEVTGLLLEAERRRLNILSKEVSYSNASGYGSDGGSFETISTSSSDSLKERVKLQASVRLYQEQLRRLEIEYRKNALGILKQKGTFCLKKSRSQPAIGLKAASKSRPTIFGTVTSNSEPSSERFNNKCKIPPYCAFHHSADNSKANNLVEKHSDLVSGKLEDLILRLVPTAHYYPDHAFVFAFLLCSRLFLKPYELLNRVIDLCHSSFRKYPEESSASNLIRLMAEWTEFFPYDFRDDRLMEALGKMTSHCLEISRNKCDVERVLRNLQDRLSKLREYESLLKELEVQRAQNPPPADLPAPFSYDANALARQLTHLELEQLSFIGPQEFIQTFTKDRSALDPRDLKKTKNLESYVAWFNRLSFLIATNICRHSKKKHRARSIEFWIEVGRECFNIGNFNSLMAVLAGLNLSPITRLKKTWSKVQTVQLEVLEQQMAPTSNFLSYRSTLAAALWRRESARDDGERIIIPFFSLLVKDLYFLNEGCAGKLPNGHINFEKCWQLARQVSEFVAWQREVCPFSVDAGLCHRLQTCHVFSEDELARASFLCENPENNFERERLKSLQ